MTATEGVPTKSVTVFVGSARKSGLTHTAARQLLDRLEAYGDVRGEIVFLSDHDLGLCRGCKVCFARGEERCPLGGDRDLLLAKMDGSDGVVFASPNYSFQVSAITKAFLDRLGFVFHRPRFHGKSFTSLVVQGFYGGGRIERYLAFVGAGLGFNVVKGSCITGLEPMAEKDRRRMDSALAAQSRRFHALLSRPALRSPTIFQLMGFRMGRTCVRQTLTETDRDYVYYRERGWLESDYFFPIELGPFKKALGAIFDRIFARTWERPGAPPRLAASEPRR
jgi:multimeric flavodoxin WrbA